MKTTRKILAVLIAVVMTMSLFSICAFAIDPNGDEAVTFRVETDKESYDKGDVVTVSVYATTNFNYTAFRLPIMFDSAMYELNTITTATTYGKCKSNGTIGVNPNAQDKIPEAYDQSEWGCVLVQWTASVSNGTVGVINTNGQEELAFSFKLLIKDDAESGHTGTIKIPAEYDGFYPMAIKDPTDATTIYYMDEVSLSMLFVDANATVGTSAASELVAVLGSPSVIDNENYFVYGLATGFNSPDSFGPYVEATNGGTIEITPTEIGYGTGTQISVVGNGTPTVYTAIVFGDGNGDGFSDMFDLNDAVEYAGTLKLPENDNVVFALDIAARDGKIDMFDVNVLYEVSGGMTVLDQANPWL